MRLSNVKRFLDEDFKDQRPWIERLIRPLNRYLSDLATILNQGITLSDNIASKVYSVDLSAGTSEFLFKWDLSLLPSFVAIAQISEVGSSAVPITGFSWTYEDGAIKCKVSGLSGGAAYRIKILAMV